MLLVLWILLGKEFEHDLLLLERIDTSVNCSDALTKPNSRILFNRHLDQLMGRMPPAYATQSSDTPVQLPATTP